MQIKKNLKIIDIENLNNDRNLINCYSSLFGSQLRIIKYEVKNSKFCLLTNLLNNEEFDLTNIQNIYNKSYRSSVIICKRSSLISYFKYNIKNVKK